MNCFNNLVSREYRHNIYLGMEHEIARATSRYLELGSVNHLSFGWLSWTKKAEENMLEKWANLER